jgi:hypothetical protein
MLTFLNNNIRAIYTHIDKLLYNVFVSMREREKKKESAGSLLPTKKKDIWASFFNI